MTRKYRVVLSVFFLLVMGWGFSGFQALGHWADMSALELAVAETTVKGELTIPVSLLSFADENKNKILEVSEFDKNAEKILAFLSGKIYVSEADTNLELLSATLSQQSQMQNFVTLSLLWQRLPSADSSLGLSYQLYAPEATNAHCLVSMQNESEVLSWIVTPADSAVVLQQANAFQRIKKFVRLGFEHILTGYDHLLFLLSLLLVHRGRRYLLQVITAFTLAHSLTLSLSVLGWVNVPSKPVELFIALSIIYVLCVDVLWRKREPSLLVVFAFGLIHGLGFAGILKEMALPAGQRLVALLSFNAGIEMGQLILALLIWSGIRLLNRYQAVQVIAQPLLTYSALILACIWCIERIM